LVVFYPSFYVVLNNWNRKCFWTSVVYILWNGLYRAVFNVSVHPKKKILSSFTLKLFQTCMNFFLLLNTKETKQLMGPLTN